MWRVLKHVLVFIAAFLIFGVFWSVEKPTIESSGTLSSLLSPRSRSGEDGISSVYANRVENPRRLASLAGSGCIVDPEGIIPLLISEGIAPKICLEALVRIDAAPHVLYRQFSQYLQQPHGLSDANFVTALIDQRPGTSFDLLLSDVGGRLSEDAREILLEHSLVDYPDQLQRLAETHSLTSSVIVQAIARSARLAHIVLSSENIAAVNEEVRAAALKSILANSSQQRAFSQFPIAEFPQFQELYWDVMLQEQLSHSAGSLTLQDALQYFETAPVATKDQLVEEWLSLNPSEVLAWLDEAPDEALAPSLIAKALRQAAVLSMANASSVAALLDRVNVLNERETTQAFVSFVKRFGEADLSSAFAWADQIKDPLVQERAHSTVITTALRQDPYSTAQHIADLSPGTVRDLAIQSLVAQIPDDPERILQWSSQISDMPTRNSAVENAVYEWAVWDLSGALSVLPTLSLPPEHVDRIREVLNTVP